MQGILRPVLCSQRHRSPSVGPPLTRSPAHRFPCPHFVSSSQTDARPRSTPQIDDAAIDRYILKIDRNDWDAHADQHGVRWPLQFDSLDDELNLLASVPSSSTEPAPAPCDDTTQHFVAMDPGPEQGRVYKHEVEQTIQFYMRCPRGNRQPSSQPVPRPAR